MTTVVNNPTPAAQPAEDKGGSNFLIGAILIIGFVMVLLYFGIPALKRAEPVQLNIPSTQVVVPDKVDVNVTMPK